MEKKQSTWSILSAINCNDHTEQKNGLTYLSWAWAWGIVKENFPTANYKVRQYNGIPYLFDENLGYLVTTEVTIDGETIEMSLPVMDGANKAQKNVAYTYKVKDYRTKEYVEKTVSAATMFDINTAIMRCLTKNLAMFGLGHYIYAGEDLPKASEDLPKASNDMLEEAIDAVKQCDNIASLQALWNCYTDLQKNATFKAEVSKRKGELKNVA